MYNIAHNSAIYTFNDYIKWHYFILISQKNYDFQKGTKYIFQFQKLNKNMVEFQFYRKSYDIILIMYSIHPEIVEIVIKFHRNHRGVMDKALDNGSQGPGFECCPDFVSFK